MKTKKFIKLKKELFNALSTRENTKAQQLKQKLYQAIFDRKNKGKDTGIFNFH